METKDNQDQELQDSGFRILGYYFANQNVTKDRGFRIIGYGNVLLSLLPD